MTLTLMTPKLPLRMDEGGTVRVGATRISLDLVVAAFRDGTSPEEIVHHWPTLSLADVYAAIAFYLRNEAAVDAYLAEQERDAEAVRGQVETRQQPDVLRARLQALRAEREP